MTDLIDFLKGRNVGEDCIKALLDNKIDNHVILTMEDSDLKTYLPAHGDRIAAYAFCKTMEEPSQSEANGNTTRTRLLDRVRNKIRKKRQFGSSNDEGQFESRSCARKKVQRRIELGWMDFDGVAMNFKQVRSANGGGTRHLSVPRETTEVEIIDIGKSLFFPDGVSRKGMLSDFKFSARDFQMGALGESSVAELYEQHKVKLLRLYICTEKVVGADCTSEETPSEETTDTSRSTVQNAETLPDILPTESSGDVMYINSDEEVTDVPKEADGHSDSDVSSGTPTVIFSRQATRRRRLRLIRHQTGVNTPRQQTSQQLHEETNSQPLHNMNVTSGTSDMLEAGTSASLSDQEDDNLPELFVTAENDVQLKNEINDGFRFLSDLLTEEQELSVNRGNAAAELLALYEDREIMFKRVKVTFNGEMGDDFGGLTKDLYTVAWKSILEEYFTGEDSMVPYLPLHKQRKLSKQYLCIGRVLSHTAALVQEIPARISRSTLIQLVFGPDGVGEDILMQDFRLFLPPVERRLIEKALSRFSTLSEKENSTLLTVFSVHGLLELPKESEIKDQILAMAQNELVHKPAPFISLMKRGIPETHLDVFWSRLTNNAISHIYNKQIPTASKVVAITEPEGELKAEEEASIHYLQQYIYSLDSEELSDFLIFVTGSSSMPDKITVSFTSLTGLSRRPIAHTCSNLLELPATYSSVHDLKREFKKILSNEYAFQMSMF